MASTEWHDTRNSKTTDPMAGNVDEKQLQNLRPAARDGASDTDELKNSTRNSKFQFNLCAGQQQQLRIALAARRLTNT